jgi:hypothetical protein
MRTILAAVVVGAGAAGLAAQDKKYERDGKFAAAFPAAPTVRTAAAGGLALTFVSTEVDMGKSAFVVVYNDIPPDKLKAPTPEQVLASSEQALKDDAKMKNVKATPTAFGPKKYPAREITAERDDRHIRGTVVLAGNRLYQVYVLGSKEFTTSKEADAFLASFAITD